MKEPILQKPGNRNRPAGKRIQRVSEVQVTEEILEALKYAGFDVLVTANNHSLTLWSLVRYTLDELDKYGFMYTGTAQ